jgi:hypothetical protein
MLITRDIVVAIPSGIAIPQSQIAFYQWKAQPITDFKVEISDNENARFTLYRRTFVKFIHFLHRINNIIPFVLSENEYVIEEKTEPFLESALYTDLSENNQAKMEELLQKILQNKSRVQMLSTGINLPDTSTEHLEEYTKRKRNLDRRLVELEKFTQAKSGPITNNGKEEEDEEENFFTISEARKTEWWTLDTAEYFENLIIEAYTKT